MPTVWNHGHEADPMSPCEACRDLSGPNLVSLPTDWLTVPQVMRALGVSKRTLLHTIPSSALPYMRVNARGDRRYRRTDVLAFIERNTVR